MNDTVGALAVPHGGSPRAWCPFSSGQIPGNRGVKSEPPECGGISLQAELGGRLDVTQATTTRRTKPHPEKGRKIEHGSMLRLDLERLADDRERKTAGCHGALWCTPRPANHGGSDAG